MDSTRQLEIPLVVVGCDYRTAAATFREPLITSPEERGVICAGISSLDNQAGFAALETCNRVEWIASTDALEWVAQLLIAQMRQRWLKVLPDAQEYPTPYVYTGRTAAKHLLEVVAGLQSLAIGESQIAGQFQRALKRSREEGTASDILNGLTNAAGRLARSGYRIGFRSNHHVGVHGLAADLLASHFNGSAPTRTVVVAGMGTIGRKVATTLEQLTGYRVVKVNRTVDPQHTGEWRQFDELEEALTGADALVVATGALSPVIQTQQLTVAAERGLLVVDIGIPRQVDPAAQNLPGIDYRCVDDLDPRNRQSEAHSEAEVQREVEKEIARFERFCIERNIISLLSATQRRRKNFIQRHIPSIVELEFGELDPQVRKRVETSMKQLISDYASDSFDSIHKALERYWSIK